MGIVKDVLQNLCAYFSHNPKRIEEFVELADIVETRGSTNFEEHQNPLYFKVAPT
jgi:hypothetical protein